MSFISNSTEIARNLAEEQAKPIGLFTGLFKNITKAFEEHKQHLEERVIAQREKKIILAEEEQKIEAETPKSFLKAMLDKWLFDEERVPQISAIQQDYSRELVHIGGDKTSSIPIEPEPQKSDSLLAMLGNLPSPSTPAVARSHSQDVGRGFSLA